MNCYSYQDLEAWKKSMDLVVEVYRLSKLLPRDEQFGLINQMRRSVVSVPANIAEGQGRLHKADFLRFLSIARGSLTESETHVLVALRLEYLHQGQIDTVLTLFQEVGRLLNGLIRSLENGNSQGSIRISETPEFYDPTTEG